MRLETYKMAASIFLKFLTLKCNISRTILRIEVSDGSLFCIFHALSFELNLFFDRTCPLTVFLGLPKNKVGKCIKSIHVYHLWVLTGFSAKSENKYVVGKFFIS